MERAAKGFFFLCGPLRLCGEWPTRGGYVQLDLADPGLCARVVDPL